MTGNQSQFSDDGLFLKPGTEANGFWGTLRYACGSAGVLAAYARQLQYTGNREERERAENYLQVAERQVSGNFT